MSNEILSVDQCRLEVCPLVLHRAVLHLLPNGGPTKAPPNVYLFERERERERERTKGEGQIERETQNLKQAPGSKLSVQSPMRGLNPPTVRS